MVYTYLYSIYIYIWNLPVKFAHVFTKILIDTAKNASTQIFSSIVFEIPKNACWPLIRILN